MPIAKSEHITTALIKLREEQHIKTAINMIFHAEHPGTLATNITDKWRFDKTASGRFVADLIRGAYKSRIQPILQPLEQDIDRAADILRDTPRNELSLQLIERKLSEWDEYAQPLQLIDEGKGLNIHNKLKTPFSDKPIAKNILDSELQATYYNQTHR